VSKDAWLVAAGDFEPEQLNALSQTAGDILIGVDGGVAHCVNAGFVPDIIIGDFDSVDESVLRCPQLSKAVRKHYPVRKNFSDLELALQCSSEAGVERVISTGCCHCNETGHLRLNSWIRARMRTA